MNTRRLRPKRSAVLNASIACPPAAGQSYRPVNPLSAFDGTNANGTWVLSVSDNAAIDMGTLNGWGLRITISGASCGTPTTPSPSPTCSAGGGATWTDVAHIPVLKGRALGVTFGSSIYVFGGRPDNTTYTQDVYRYDTVPNTWSLLTQQLPETVGQAARIQGVTPAAISLLLVHLKRRGHALHAEKSA